MKKVSEEELVEMQTLSTMLNDIIVKLGELGIDRLIVLEELSKLDNLMTEQNNRFAGFRNKEKVLFEKLTKKYGTSNIDVVTGEIKE